MNRIVMVGAVIACTACGAKGPDAAVPSGATDSGSAVAVTGVVKKAEVGVGCWQLLAADSTRYELRTENAPDSILVDGKQVTVKIKPRPDLMSTCMVGQIVDVVP